MKSRLALAAAIAAFTLMAAPAFAALKVGDKAPDFTTQGSRGGAPFEFNLASALKKGPVVIYFFPAAFTDGCTLETKAFADAADQYTAAGATLIGVTGGAKLADGSMGSAKDNQARVAEFSKEACRDKFPIAAVSADTIKAYDVTLPMKADMSNRTSYVIGKDGTVALSYSDFKPNEHVTKTLDAVKALKK